MKISLLNEVLIPVGDYFRTLRRNEIIYEWLLPLVLAVFGGFFLLYADLQQIQRINATITNFTAILVGFSVAALSIVASSSGKTTEELKNHKTPRKIHGVTISLYRLTLANFIYLLAVEFFIVLMGILHLLAQPLLSVTYARWTYAPILFLFIHAVFLNLRNLSAFYFTFSPSGKQGKGSPPPGGMENNQA